MRKKERILVQSLREAENKDKRGAEGRALFRLFYSGFASLIFGPTSILCILHVTTFSTR